MLSLNNISKSTCTWELSILIDRCSRYVPRTNNYLTSHLFKEHLHKRQCILMTFDFKYLCWILTWILLIQLWFSGQYFYQILLDMLLNFYEHPRVLITILFGLNLIHDMLQITHKNSIDASLRKWYSRTSYRSSECRLQHVRRISATHVYNYILSESTCANFISDIKCFC